MANSVLTQREEEKQFPKLSKEEQQYHGQIMSRLLRAKTDRDDKHAEFDKQTYLEHFNENERLANTFVPGRDTEFKDRQGNVIISSGTVEQKLQTMVSEIARLNLGAEIRAFDDQAKEVRALGRGLTDILVKTEEWEGDEEGKINRIVELLKQGTVFVQEQWIKEYQIKKELQNKSRIGKVKGVEWSSKLEKVFEGPRRKILHGPGVFLGNIREYTMKRQPFVYTVNITSYQEAKSRYGQKDSEGNHVWERWPNVPRKKVNLLTESSLDNQDVLGGFSLFESQDDRVEEVHYQDAINNEFQIYLNGIPMLPVGFPLSAVSPDGGFNIEKQILHTINPFFAYGRSFVARTRHFADLIDEVLRLLMLKTRKSIHPPYANTSGRVISPKALMPARITMGIDPDSLVPIGQEGQGATAAEFQMLQELRNGLDHVTVSPQLEGQRGQAGTTAFEVSVLQQQAQKLILLSIASSTFLEKKLGRMRLDNILANFFTPEKTKFDEEKKKIRNIFRRVSVEGNIEGRGEGSREIIPVNEDEVPTSREIMDLEDFDGTPEPPEGERRKTRDQLRMKPVEKIFLNTDEIRKGRNVFSVQVESRTDDTSVSARRMFREELRDLANLVQFGARPDVDYLEEKHAENWGREKSRVFQENVREALNPEQQEELESKMRGFQEEGNTEGVSTVSGTGGGASIPGVSGG